MAIDVDIAELSGEIIDKTFRKRVKLIQNQDDGPIHNRRLENVGQIVPGMNPRQVQGEGAANSFDKMPQHIFIGLDLVGGLKTHHARKEKIRLPDGVKHLPHNPGFSTLPGRPNRDEMAPFLRNLSPQMGFGLPDQIGPGDEEVEVFIHRTIG
jgi:hypothetical protein